MSLADNKALVERFIEEVVNDGNTDAINELCVPGSMFAGGIEGQLRGMKSPFPDLHHTIDEMIAEGDKVAVRVSQLGTNSGTMVGLPDLVGLRRPYHPQGTQSPSRASMSFKVAEGRIVSYTMEMDEVGLLRQLGWTFTPPG